MGVHEKTWQFIDILYTNIKNRKKSNPKKMNIIDIVKSINLSLSSDPKYQQFSTKSIKSIQMLLSTILNFSCISPNVSSYYDGVLKYFKKWPEKIFEMQVWLSWISLRHKNIIESVDLVKFLKVKYIPCENSEKPANKNASTILSIIKSRGKFTLPDDLEQQNKIDEYSKAIEYLLANKFLDFVVLSKAGESLSDEPDKSEKPKAKKIDTFSVLLYLANNLDAFERDYRERGDSSKLADKIVKHFNLEKRKTVTSCLTILRIFYPKKRRVSSRKKGPVIMFYEEHKNRFFRIQFLLEKISKSQPVISLLLHVPVKCIAVQEKSDVNLPQEKFLIRKALAGELILPDKCKELLKEYKDIKGRFEKSMSQDDFVVFVSRLLVKGYLTYEFLE